MKKTGFTLIELLVVVLIIGILSAIAVPQYMTAVEKVRSAEALTNLKALATAMELYILANGEPSKNLDNLEIFLEGEKISDTKIALKNFTYDIRNFLGGMREYEIVATRKDDGSDLHKYYIYYSATHDNELECVAKTEAAKKICAPMCLGNSFSAPSVNGYFYCVITKW